MNNQKTESNQIEIKDLIDSSIANAVERRNSGSDSKEFLSELSDNEAKLTKGGINIIDVCNPTTMGYAGHPPTLKLSSFEDK